MFYGSASLRRPEFNPRPVLVSFVVDKWQRDGFILRVLWFAPVIIITPVTHVHFFTCHRLCVASAINSIVRKHTSTNSWLCPKRMDLCYENLWLGYLPLQRIELDTSRIRTACYILQFDVPLTESTALGRDCSLDSGFLILPTSITARFTFLIVFGCDRPLAVHLRFDSRQGRISVFATLFIPIVEPSQRSIRRVPG
jgi:hypothetical protein